MKISKKTLDEAIKLGREYVVEDTYTRDNIKYYDKCTKLEKEANSDIDWEKDVCFSAVYFYEIIEICAQLNKPNETIYKAIELLGIDIE